MIRAEPIACTLSSSELPDRLESARQLGEAALVGVEASALRARLRFAGECERIDALVAAESRCCSFFTFQVSETDGFIELEILTPEGGELALQGLVAAIVAGWEGGL